MRRRLNIKILKRMLSEQGSYFGTIGDLFEVIPCLTAAQK